ncbi:hypothetical protein [Sphingomonas sanguinis]|uniref:hypothetical protein n=1 Tax=Sphingomonas sanguinis TaxID=33051 RepID=UPI003017D0C6
MPKSRNRKKVGVNSPNALKRSHEGHQYRQSINWSKSLVLKAAGWLGSMIVTAFSLWMFGPKATFTVYATLMLLALLGAFLMALKAKRHNRRFKVFNQLMPVGARIAPPDRIRRPY